ncbi:hypothetical protein A4G20_06495 [Pasteurellaceae bacterium RH1A]|nr:hypothetical protein A4G20_06495 [Pasteurellaceae bacterium RH1A]
MNFTLKTLAASSLFLFCTIQTANATEMQKPCDSMDKQCMQMQQEKMKGMKDESMHKMGEMKSEKMDKMQDMKSDSMGKMKDMKSDKMDSMKSDNMMGEMQKAKEKM